MRHSVAARLQRRPQPAAAAHRDAGQPRRLRRTTAPSRVRRARLAAARRACRRPCRCRRRSRGVVEKKREKKTHKMSREHSSSDEIPSDGPRPSCATL